MVRNEAVAPGEPTWSSKAAGSAMPLWPDRERLEAELLGVPHEDRRGLGVEDDQDGVGVGPLQAQHLGGGVVGVGRHLLVQDGLDALLLEGLHQRRVAGAPPGIAHGDDGDALGALVEGELKLGRALERRGERRTEDRRSDRRRDAVMDRRHDDHGYLRFRQGLAGRDGRIAAAAADDGEDLVLMDQLLDRPDGRRRVASIVLANQFELAAVDAPGRIDLVENHLDAIHRQLAVEIARTRQRAERPDLDRIRRDAGHLRLAGLQRRDRQEQAGQARLQALFQCHRPLRPPQRTHDVPSNFHSLCAATSRIQYTRLSWGNFVSGLAEEIVVTVADGVVTVTLNRPAKRNAVSLAMWRRLAGIFAGVGRQDGVRAVVLTGAGGNFCAGADISEFATVRADSKMGEAYEAVADSATRAVRDCELPTIAAVSGYAMGGGCGLALACDFRIGDGQHADGHTRRPPGHRLRAARLLAAAAAGGPRERQARALLGARLRSCRLPPNGPRRHGSRTGQRPRGAAHAFAADLSKNAPLSIRGAKLVLDALATGTADARAGEIDAFIGRAMDSADYKEGAAAFAAKRPPRFVGR